MKTTMTADNPNLRQGSYVEAFLLSDIYPQHRPLKGWGANITIPQGGKGQTTPDVIKKDSGFFTSKELAQYLSVSIKWVEKHAAARRIPGLVKVGRVLRFKKTAVEKAVWAGSLLLPEKRPG